jgi:hypothetical protein
MEGDGERAHEPNLGFKAYDMRLTITSEHLASQSYDL